MSNHAPTIKQIFIVLGVAAAVIFAAGVGLGMWIGG